MKIMLPILQILLFCFAVVHQGNASELSWESKNWSVSGDSQDKDVYYIANGDVVHGHEFGFIKKAGNCNQDLLWISWTTYKKGIDSFKGNDAGIQFRISDAQFQLGIPLIAVVHVSPPLTVVIFSNFLAGDKWISLLKKGAAITVTIKSPKELVSKFDITTDSFSLNGYTAARLKAREFCERYNSSPGYGENHLLTKKRGDMPHPVGYQ